MKTAIISDVHGNYPALIKVIEDAFKNRVDKFVFVGDYIFDLPFSNEVVHTIMNLKNSFVIAGNKESYINALKKENQEKWTFKQMGAIYQTYRELSDDIIDFLVNLDEDLIVPLNSDRSIYAAHYLKEVGPQAKMNYSSSVFHKKMLSVPFSHEEYLVEFSEFLKHDDWTNAIRKINSSVIVFGHNHLQGFGYCGGKLIINPGSCGQPLDFNNNASYTILEETDNGFVVVERRVAYDIKSTIDIAKKSSIYANGTIWCELCFLALRTGRDFFGIFFEIAYKIACSKNENGKIFSNETWEESYEIFLKSFNIS